MSALCLNAAERRRLDGFQNRCVRSIIGIKPSFISRISNVSVLQKARHHAATLKLQKKQLQMLGKILRSPSEHPLHQISFGPGLIPVTDRFGRRRGRPNKEFVAETWKQAIQWLGTSTRVKHLASDKNVWDASLRSHFGF